MTRRFNNPLYQAMFLGLAWIGYFIPWTQTSNTVLNMGGYDLAEWTSLHPLTHSTPLPYTTTILIRLPLLCISLLSIISASKINNGRWSAWLLVAILPIAMLPPLEFFTSAQTDPNYRQQFVLALILLLLSLGIMINPKKRLVEAVWFGGAAIGITTLVISVVAALDLMGTTHLEIRLGMGVILSAGALTGAMLTNKKQGA